MVATSQHIQASQEAEAEYTLEYAALCPHCREGDRCRECGPTASHPGQLHIDAATSRSRGRLPEVQRHHLSRPRMTNGAI